MADDNNKDLDPEEGNNEPFGDDDDFGLPDLEYDELEDDDEFDDEFDSPASEEEPVEAEAEPSDEEAFTVDDEFEPVEEEIPIEEEPTFEEDDMAEFSEDDFNEDDIDISEEDLQKELEELESEDFNFDDDVSEEEAGFYEEETYEDFSDGDSLDSVFGDDDDLPTQPGDSLVSGPMIDTSAKQKAASQYASSYSDTKSEKGNFTRIVIIGTILILVVATALWFAYDGSGEKKEVAKKEQPTKPVEQPKIAEPEVKKEEPKKEEVKPKPKPVPTQVTAGTVTALDQRTGKTYVIISSFIDGDIALDYANQLASKGKSPYVIPPFNNGLYYRVAVAEYATFSDASANLTGYRAEYGNDTWALRY